MTPTDPGPAVSLRRLLPGIYLPTLLFEIGVGAMMPMIPVSTTRLGGSLATGGLMVALLAVGKILADVPAGALAARVGDRPGAASDELHPQDAMAEKLSLAERFGLRLAFYPPDQASYLDMVERLAEQAGLAMDREELHRRALAFEREQGGRSPGRLDTGDPRDDERVALSRGPFT